MASASVSLLDFCIRKRIQDVQSKIRVKSMPKQYVRDDNNARCHWFAVQIVIHPIFNLHVTLVGKCVRQQN